MKFNVVTSKKSTETQRDVREREGGERGRGREREGLRGIDGWRERD